MAAKTTARSRPKDYGPVQFPVLLGLPQWAFERALSAGLIPRLTRSPASVAVDAATRMDEIRATVGTQPDVGAGRAAEVLSARFGTSIPRTCCSSWTGRT